MKVVVTAEDGQLTSKVDPRFGRAACFLVVDTETLASWVVDNSQNLAASQGAGVQAAQTVVGQQVDAVVTGNCGPKAFRILTAAGVKVYVGASGSVGESLERLSRGELELTAEPNVEGHWV